jgi:hypothetical protein
VQECGALLCCPEDSVLCAYKVLSACTIHYVLAISLPIPQLPIHHVSAMLCLQCWRFPVLACLGLMLAVCTSRFHTICLYTSDFVPISTSLHIQDLTIDKVCANVALYCVGMCRAHALGLYWKIP